MTWVTYVVGAAAALAAADVFVKLATGRVPNSLGMLLYGAVAFSIGVVWTVLDRTGGSPQRVSMAGVVYALAVGLSFSAVTFGLYGAFTAGAPLSVTSPLVRLGGLIVASVCGVLIWNEPVTIRYVTGVTLALVGVYLIATR
jgi:transporter family protein